MIVQDLQRPVILDESFERRVMVRVRRLYAEKKKGTRGWTAVGATIAHRPAWAALLAAGIVAITTAGVLKHGRSMRQLLRADRNPSSSSSWRPVRRASPWLEISTTGG